MRAAVAVKAVVSMVLFAVFTGAYAETTEAPAPDKPFTRTLRSVSLEDLAERGRITGVYHGSPKVQENAQWYEDHFYDTLASRKVWHDGTGRETHERGGPITWDIVPIPQYTPPACDQPQPSGYDAEGCRIAQSLFTDIEDADKQAQFREMVRRGRDVWFKGSFGNQDLNEIHLARTIGQENMWYPWLDTRTRPYRFTKWGLINDPDCVQGNEESNWLDICEDDKSSGVLGYRKYLREPQVDENGKVVFDPASSPYQENELQANKRYTIGHACVQCHVAFDPTNPPKDPNEPEWENLTGLIGNKFLNQPGEGFLLATPHEHFAWQVIHGARRGTVDTSLNPNDFQHNPGTQNNIMDFMNKRVFMHEMKHPITGEVSEAPTLHVLKGGEDSVGDRLALLRVYINIGMCTEECWVPNFPYPGKFFGDKASQQPQRVKQCYQDCEAWNHADAKMPHLAAFLMTGGPTYLMNATDIDGTAGSSHIDTAKVPAGRKLFIRECATCHSTRVPPETIASDKDALEEFYAGHVFGKEDFWQLEFTQEERESEAFKAKYLVEDGGRLRPKQFAEQGEIFGQDWLGNDEPTPFHVIGTNMCRALHDNHNEGHIWEDYSSITYKERPSPGSIPQVFNLMIPFLGGKQMGEVKIEGGPGYLRNFSLLSAWATAPFLHNNAIGELTYLQDGTPDYTVAGRIKQFELAMEELLMSDNPADDPHREPKIARFDRDVKVAPREDGQGWIKLTVKKDTPIVHVASSDPHKPVFMKCYDPVENKGHQFGVDLSADEKLALAEFLKLM